MTSINPAEQSNTKLEKLKTITAESFLYEAEDVFNSIISERKQLEENPTDLSPAERSLPSVYAVALARTREKYVNNAEFVELANLADVIVSAQEALRVQKSLNTINDKLDEYKRMTKHGEDLNDEQTKEQQQLQAERKLGVAKILPFNHKLRELIDTVADVVSRVEVENWLEKAMNGSGGTARKMVAGMGAEVAVARLARQAFGDENVRLSTQTEDAKGIDLIIMINGRQRTVDIKTGGNIDDSHTADKEVAVEQNQISGFNIDQAYRSEVVDKLRN